MIDICSTGRVRYRPITREELTFSSMAVVSPTMIRYFEKAI